MVSAPLVAVDVGNARIKLGLFAHRRTPAAIPEPTGILPLLDDAPELEQIRLWLEGCSRHTPCAAPLPAHGVCGLQSGTLQWWIASVNRPAASRLIDWLHGHRPADHVTLLCCGDLPLEVRLPRPDMVGIDRLVDAVAVNRLRRPGSPAVIVDVGTAVTVDLVSADGAYLGGAILPGIAMSARALHEFTDLLPLVDVSDLTVPPLALGTATEPAIESGLFWGTIGAIRQLVERLGEAASGGLVAGWGGSSTATPASSTATPASSTAAPATVTPGQPQVFLTGGAGAAVAELLGPHARYVPHLTLAGIALAAGVE